MVAPFFDKGYAFVDLNSKQAVLDALRKGQSMNGKAVYGESRAQVSPCAIFGFASGTSHPNACLRVLARPSVRTCAQRRTLQPPISMTRTLHVNVKFTVWPMRERQLSRAPLVQSPRCVVALTFHSHHLPY